MTDENPRTIRDEPGEEVSVDPAATFLTQPGGLGPAFSDFVLYGVFNGAFARGPDFPANNIDPWNSAGSNFMPNWRFVQSSNTNITAKQVRDVTSPSGSNLRFTFVSGAAADEAYVEQVTPMGGANDRVLAFALRPSFENNGATTFTAWAEVAYLTVDGVLTGAAVSAASTVAAGATYNAYPQLGAPPANAFYIRDRVGTRRGATATSATGSLDVASVRLERQLGRVRVPSENFTPGTAGLVYAGTPGFGPAISLPDVMFLQSGGQTYVWVYLSGLIVDKGIILNGVITPTILGAATNNWNPTGLDTANVIRASSDANRNLTGIVAQEENRLIRFMNRGSFNIALIHESASSTAANRFSCPNATDVTVPDSGWVDLFYDEDNSRWCVSGV